MPILIAAAIFVVFVAVALFKNTNNSQEVDSRLKSSSNNDFIEEDEITYSEPVTDDEVILAEDGTTYADADENANSSEDINNSDSASPSDMENDDQLTHLLAGIAVSASSADRTYDYRDADDKQRLLLGIPLPGIVSVFPYYCYDVEEPYMGDYAANGLDGYQEWYAKISFESVRWIAENIYHMTEEDCEQFEQDTINGKYREYNSASDLYAEENTYYSLVLGVGGGGDLRAVINSIEKRENLYYITYKLGNWLYEDSDEPDTIFGDLEYAVVEQQYIDGNTCWTMYYHSDSGFSDFTGNPEDDNVDDNTAEKELVYHNVEENSDDQGQKSSALPDNVQTTSGNPALGIFTTWSSADGEYVYSFSEDLEGMTTDADGRIQVVGGQVYQVDITDWEPEVLRRWFTVQDDMITFTTEVEETPVTLNLRIEGEKLVSDHITLYKTDKTLIKQFYGEWTDGDETFVFRDDYTYLADDGVWGYYFVLPNDQLVMIPVGEDAKIYPYAISGHQLTINDWDYYNDSAVDADTISYYEDGLVGYWSSTMVTQEDYEYRLYDDYSWECYLVHEDEEIGRYAENLWDSGTWELYGEDLVTIKQSGGASMDYYYDPDSGRLYNSDNDYYLIKKH